MQSAQSTVVDGHKTIFVGNDLILVASETESSQPGVIEAGAFEITSMQPDWAASLMSPVML